MIQGIEHIGIIVADIEKVLGEFCSTYELKVPEIRFIEQRNMKLAVLPFGCIFLEFVEDLNQGSDLQKRAKEQGSFIHHFALGTTDIQSDINLLEKRECEKKGEFPTLGLRGKKVQFYVDKTLGFPIELSEI